MGFKDTGWSWSTVSYDKISICISPCIKYDIHVSYGMPSHSTGPPTGHGHGGYRQGDMDMADMDNWIIGQMDNWTWCYSWSWSSFIIVWTIGDLVPRVERQRNHFPRWEVRTRKTKDAADDDDDNDDDDDDEMRGFRRCPGWIRECSSWMSEEGVM